MRAYLLCGVLAATIGPLSAAPQCDAGKSQTYRTGSPAQLDGSRSKGQGKLAYQWRLSRGPAQVRFDNANADKPTVRGADSFGTYVFELAVTDRVGTRACEVKLGFVPSDERGVVDLQAADRTHGANLEKLIGPLIQIGKNPWPWYDDRHVAASRRQMEVRKLFYNGWWKHFQPGTITITGGSATVTGTGTSFSRLCAGGSTPRGGAIFAFQYTGSDGRTHYTQQNVARCDSDTQLTLSVTYPSFARLHGTLANCDRSCSGLKYAWTWDGDGAEEGYGATWRYGVAPANYYDNVVGFYLLYYRTGLDDYLMAARSLADDWWEDPSIDQGNSCEMENHWSQACWPRRSISLTGLVLRALDGGGSMWEGLRQHVWPRLIFYITTYVQAQGIDDIRDQGFMLAGVATCAIAELDETARKGCQNALIAAAPLWERQQDPSGGFLQRYGSEGSIRGAPSQGKTMRVNNGAASVAMNEGACPKGVFLFAFFEGEPLSYPKDNSSFEGEYYAGRCNGTTTIQLDRPYAGKSSAAKGWIRSETADSQAGSVYLGWGAQVFMEGILATGLELAGKSLDGANNALRDRYYKMQDGVVRWIHSNGIQNDATGGIGLYYSTLCGKLPLPTSDIMCYGDGYGAENKRVLAAEVIRPLGLNYARTHNASLREDADRLMSQMFCKRSADCVVRQNSGFIAALDDDGFYMTGPPPIGTAPKYYGLFFGSPESGSTWPALRLAGQSGDAQ